jgi:hypothetical protein
MNNISSLAKYASILGFSLAVTTMSWAQNVYNATKVNQDIDPSRYDKIQGSPYLYKVWQKAKIISSNGDVYYESELNYNGLTQQLEIKENEKSKPLPPYTFIKVFVEGDNGTEAFLKRIHPDFGDNVVCVSYDGQRVKLIKIFTIRLAESGAQTSIQPAAFEKFIPRVEYYIMTDGSLASIALKKKKVIKVLGHNAEIEQYIKEHSLTLKKESDLIQVLKHYEASLID